MPEPLKNLYNDQFFLHLSEVLDKFLPDFNHTIFIRNIYTKAWSSFELKQRMAHIADVVHDLLPAGYPKKVNALIAISDELNRKDNGLAFEYMFIPAVIEKYGRNDIETSLAAFEHITRFTSCEFAVRPFYIDHPEKTLKWALRWANHHHHTVRRFASEGCRPRLPWAMALPAFKKDPAPILPILNHLKTDPSEFVRRSVANNLNDISKDHPDLVLKLTAEWLGQNADTDKLLRHGCRGLLKNGNISALELFNIKGGSHLKVQKPTVANPKLKVGDRLHFDFDLLNDDKKAHLVRLEYAIYFKLSNGRESRKVFKISERNFEGSKTEKIQRSHSFRPISTRTYYPGLHYLAIIVNGIEAEKLPFHLEIT